jgi:hypothetical protein
MKGSSLASSCRRRSEAQGAQPSFCDVQGYAPGVAHYLFNFVKGDAAKGPAPREQAAAFLRAGMWGVDIDEPHRNALAPGDLVLIYLGAPEREFIGRAELASAVRDWTPSEAQVYPGDSTSGVLLAQVEKWDPPVPMNTVLSQIDPADNAKADFPVASFGSPLTSMRPPSPWRPDARPRLADLEARSVTRSSAES